MYYQSSYNLKLMCLLHTVLQIVSNKNRIALLFIIFYLVTMVTTFINFNIDISGKYMNTRPLKRFITVSDIFFLNLITLLLKFLQVLFNTGSVPE